MTDDSRRKTTDDGRKGRMTDDSRRKTTDDGRQMTEDKRISYKFEKLEVWRISLELSDVIYEIIKRLPKEEEFNLKGL